MNGSVNKKELASRLAVRMESDEKTATAWIDATFDELYEAFRAGEKVTLPGFGGFYIRQSRSGGTVFRFNPGQKLRALFGWSSTYKGEL